MRKIRYWGTYTQKECIKKIMDYNFEVLFVLRKAKKVVMKVSTSLFLIFDFKNHCNYFVENVVPKLPHTLVPSNVTLMCPVPSYTVDDEDNVYMWRDCKESDHSHTATKEIRAFEYRNTAFIKICSKLMFSPFVLFKKALRSES